MNKTTLTESMIEEIIMLETLAAMKDRGLLPEYNTKMKEKVDLLTLQSPVSFLDKPNF